MTKTLLQIEYLRLSSLGPLIAKVLALREAWTLGLLKWSTLPSSLIMFTSSMPWIALTLSLRSVFCVRGGVGVCLL